MMRQAWASTMPMLAMLTVAVSPMRTVRLLIQPSAGALTSVLLSFHSAVALSATATARAALGTLMLVWALSMAISAMVFSAAVRLSSLLARSRSARGALFSAASTT